MSTIKAVAFAAVVFVVGHAHGATQSELPPAQSQVCRILNDAADAWEALYQQQKAVKGNDLVTDEIDARMKRVLHNREADVLKLTRGRIVGWRMSVNYVNAYYDSIIPNDPDRRMTSVNVSAKLLCSPIITIEGEASPPFAPIMSRLREGDIVTVSGTLVHNVGNPPTNPPVTNPSDLDFQSSLFPHRGIYYLSVSSIAVVKN